MKFTFTDLDVIDFMISAELPPSISDKITTRAEAKDSGESIPEELYTSFKHVLLPITDRNPYLSEGTRQVLPLSHS